MATSHAPPPGVDIESCRIVLNSGKGVPTDCMIGSYLNAKALKPSGQFLAFSLDLYLALINIITR